MGPKITTKRQRCSWGIFLSAARIMFASVPPQTPSSKMCEKCCPGLFLRASGNFSKSNFSATSRSRKVHRFFSCFLLNSIVYSAFQTATKQVTMLKYNDCRGTHSKEVQRCRGMRRSGPGEPSRPSRGRPRKDGSPAQARTTTSGHEATRLESSQWLVLLVETWIP